MALSDKILNLFEKYGALSSERVTNLLEKDYLIKKDIRTIQRWLAKLAKERKIVRLPSTRREQTYTLFKEQPALISDLFVSRIWEELFELRSGLHKPDDQFAQDWEILRKLRSLVQMLPQNIKDEIVPSIDSFPNLNKDEEKELIEIIEGQIGRSPILTVGGYPFGEDEIRRKTIKQDIIGRFLEKKVEEIIGKITTALHEELRKSRIS